MQSFEDNNERLLELKKKFNKVQELLTYEEVLLDKKLFLHLEKLRMNMLPTIECLDKLNVLESEMKTLSELSFGDSSNIFDKEESILLDKISKQKEKILESFRIYLSCEEKILLVIVNLGKARELLDILINAYKKTCERQSFECQEIGFGDFCLRISGLGVRSFFEKEIGVHNDKDNTNQCCVVILDDVLEDVSFEDGDFEISISRASGAGGQHINTTDSAVRVVHKSTGISAICSDERSQIQNKKVAMERVQTKVIEHFQKKNEKRFKELKGINLAKLQSEKAIRVYDLRNKTFEEFGKTFLINKILN